MASELSNYSCQLQDKAAPRRAASRSSPLVVVPAAVVVLVVVYRCQGQAERQQLRPRTTPFVAIAAAAAAE